MQALPATMSSHASLSVEDEALRSNPKSPVKRTLRGLYAQNASSHFQKRAHLLGQDRTSATIWSFLDPTKAGKQSATES